jgi:hypothetical protein
MPELIYVPLADLEMGEEYSVIFPLEVIGVHEAYDAEFVEDNTQEYLFEIVRVHAGPKSVGDRFSVRVDEQTFDIADRVGKYLILTEEVIPFPDDLADAHVDTSADAEVGAIFTQGDNARMRLLNRLLMRSRSPTRSPLRRLSPMSPFSRSQTPLNGGRRRRRRTRRRPARKRPSRRRSRSTRRRSRPRRTRPRRTRPRRRR